MTRTAFIPRQTPRALRLRPGIVIVTLLWSTWIGLPLLAPEAAPIAMVGALLGVLGVLVWWAFFSGAAPIERWGAPLLMLAVSLATVPLLDVSISSSMMGLMFPVYTPVSSQKPGQLAEQADQCVSVKGPTQAVLHRVNPGRAGRGAHCAG